MRLRKIVLQEGVRLAGSYLAVCGARQFHDATAKSALLYVSGSVLEKLPDLYGSGERTMLSHILAARTVIAAAEATRGRQGEALEDIAARKHIPLEEAATMGGAVSIEAAHYTAYRRIGSIMLGTLNSEGSGRMQALGRLADDISIATDVVAERLAQEGDIGFSSWSSAGSKLLHFASTLALGYSAVETVSEAA